MAKNLKLRFKPRKRGHDGLCGICGGRVGKRAVAAEFHPDEPPKFACVYCEDCIGKLYATSRKVK